MQKLKYVFGVSILAILISVQSCTEGMNADLFLSQKWKLDKITDEDGKERGKGLLNLVELINGDIIMEFESDGEMRFEGNIARFFGVFDTDEAAELRWTIVKEEGQAFINIKSEDGSKTLIPIVSISSDRLEISTKNEDESGFHLVFETVEEE